MHLYTPTGEPVYEVPYADKKRAGEMRKPTLADARKRGLYPGVTDVLNILADPGLDVWKINTHIEAALTHPQDGRPVDDLIPEIKKNAEEFGRVARELGTLHHDAIEGEVAMAEGLVNAYNRDECVPLATVVAFRDWYANSGLKLAENGIERYFASPLGYGGRIDYIGTWGGWPVVVDWKTQKTKASERFKFYQKWAAQLAAYAHGAGLNMSYVHLMSVAISTTEPGRMDTKVWADNDAWLSAFLATFDVWKGPLGKNYNPLEKAA
jgi:hypothetical protein